MFNYLIPISDDENEGVHFDFDPGQPAHNNNNLVPTTDAVNTFLQSFDSATSMVFHGRTGGGETLNKRPGA